MPTLKLELEGIEGIPAGTEIILRKTCTCCGPGPAKCPGIINTTDETVRDETFPPSEPPSRLGGGPALRLLPAPEPDELTHEVPLLEATG